jgi:hypothetical protein
VHGKTTPEKKPFIEKVVDAKASTLPAKVFERPRKRANKIRIAWQSIILFPFIFVPIVLVEVCVYPVIQYVGNLPLYDCT